MFWNKRKDLIEYAEQEARINASFHLECAEALTRASASLLTILLTGAGGALGLFISLYGNDEVVFLSVGSLAISLYLFGVAMMLVTNCLKVRDIYPPANEPMNIYSDEYKKLHYLTVKELDLVARQKCIKANIYRNKIVGNWLNKVRILAVSTPFVFILSGLLASLVFGFFGQVQA